MPRGLSGGLARREQRPALLLTLGRLAEVFHLRAALRFPGGSRGCGLRGVARRAARVALRAVTRIALRVDALVAWGGRTRTARDVTSSVAPRPLLRAARRAWRRVAI